MSEQSIAQTHVYDGWLNYQRQIITALEPLTDDQLNTRPAPQLRSIGENASHLVAVRAGWLYYNLKREDARLAPFADWWQPQPRSAAEIIAGLEATWGVIQDALNEWTIADLAVEVIDTDENDQEYTVTRQWVIWHLLEHDIHHGGEISVTVGMLGNQGIDMRYTNHG